MVPHNQASVFAGLVLLGTAALLTAAPQDAAKLELRRAETKPAEGLVEATVSGTNTKIYLYKAVELSNSDIESARAVGEDSPGVEVTFSALGRGKAAKLSKEHRGKPLAILVDGKVVAAPIVRTDLGPAVLITGQFTKAEAERLANGLTGKK